MANVMIRITADNGQWDSAEFTVREDLLTLPNADAYQDATQDKVQREFAKTYLALFGDKRG